MSLLKSILNMLFNTAVEGLNQKEERRVRTAAPTSNPEPKPIVDPNAYFAEILATEFPQYSVKRNVPVTDLAGFDSEECQLYETRPVQSYKAEWGKPYTFVLYRGEKPAGVVMLGGGHSHDKNVKYLISRMYCKKLGMPYINFYLQMENERNYVIERIKDLMLGH